MTTPVERIAIVIPCHRVVGGNGSLTGFGGGLDVQVHPVISIRAFQFDYLRTHLHRDRPNMLADQIPALKDWQNSYRFLVGVTFRLGERQVR